MLTVNSVSVKFGATVLFDNVSFVLNPRERVGLAGKNGAGKSTLMKIIAGWQTSTDGSVDVAKGTKICYLPQDLKVSLDKTVLNETKTAFDEIMRLQKRLEEITDLIINTDPNHEKYMDWLVEQSDIMERMDILGAETIEADTIKVLEGLGFKQTDFDRHTSELSGGWLMRIELAKILLQHPDVILLDEPTNHLDIESIQWLEEWMNNYSGVVLMVSHDRTFLNTVTNRTIEISNQKIYDYKCKYDDYLIERVTQRELQLATQKNQMKEYERTEALIDKFRAKASKATMAQSLIKKLDKMEVMEIDNDDTSSMKFSFPDAPRSGLTVVEVKNLSKSYGEKNILKNVGLKIERGEKVGFVGKNGMGKTTMGKMIVGEENFEGMLDLGTNVSIGYYAQHQSEKLESNDTVLETIENALRPGVDINARSLLGAFLFSGDNVTKKVKVLSGGEKSRLSLAKLMLEEHNVLILDEPTNHLDIRSIEVLKASLERFNGTIIIISHDRDFLAGLASKTFEFLDGNVKEYLGDINYFLEQKKLTNIRDFEEQMAANLKAKEKKNKEDKLDSRTDDKDAERRKKDLKNCEEKISTTEHAIAVIEAKMGNMTDFQGDDYKKLFNEHQKLKTELTALMNKWEELASID
ncbi:MAG: hypothetical protein RIQ33_1571 [Bacteroidota bacterium]|jgi:ATP-binding cassette subfamily F protein 3